LVKSTWKHKILQLDRNAFESGLSHIKQIKATLGIAAVSTNIANWKSKNSENGVEIVLLINRKDNIVNICEIKYSEKNCDR
jgi:uncharacterized protein (DUF4213/DUF364 family)